MRATFIILLRPRANMDGKQTVWMRATFDRKSKYFSLGRQCLSDQWNTETSRFRKNYPSSADENDMLRTYEQRAADVIREMERDGKVFSFDVFGEAVFPGSKKKSGEPVKVVAYMLSIRQEMADGGNLGNSTFYRNTAAVIRDFQPRAAMRDITPGWLERFEAWQRKRGIKDGGISVNMRTLRATINRAKKAGVMDKSWAPFSAYSLSHLRGANIKRAIPLDKIREMECLRLDGVGAFAVDLFLFSFYCRGINMADIAALTNQNIKDGRLIYERKKTGKMYNVRINEKAAEIMRQYARKEDARLFPIYSTGIHETDLQKFNRLHKITGKVNLALKSVAEMIGVPVDGFVFYTARHTYATALKKKGVGIAVIAEALGHSDIRTTEDYLKSFGDEVLDAADGLLD